MSCVYIDPCATKDCQNGGQCQTNSTPENPTDDAVCECEISTNQFYSGEFCEILADSCPTRESGNNPCAETGECFINNIENAAYPYYCTCDTGFVGRLCDEDQRQYTISKFYVPMEDYCEDGKEGANTNSPYIGGPLSDKNHQEVILPALQDAYPDQDLFYRRALCYPVGSFGSDGARQYGEYYIVVLSSRLQGRAKPTKYLRKAENRFSKAMSEFDVMSEDEFPAYTLGKILV